jgi:succinyl-diaminopimelate desuccinylase
MDLIELIVKLVEFPSYSGNVEAIKNCLQYCIDYFDDIRDKIFIKKIENNGVQSVLLSNCDTLDYDILEVGHIDVVPVNDSAMFKPKIVGNIMYGRGVADMKGPVAVGMKILEYVLKNDINLRYGLLIVTDEESGGFNGAKYWSENIGLKTKLLINADAGESLNEIIYKSKGSLLVKLSSVGEPSHGSRPWLGIDANENIINVVNNLRKSFAYYSKNNVPEDEWINTMHVSTISGGKAPNVISDYAEAVLDFRFTEDYTIDSLMEVIKDNLENDVSATKLIEGNLIFNKPENEYLQLYRGIVEKNTGKKVFFNYTTGSSDARYFAKDGVTILSAKSDSGDIHGDKEWLDIEKIKIFMKMRLEFLKALV